MKWRKQTLGISQSLTLPYIQLKMQKLFKLWNILHLSSANKCQKSQNVNSITSQSLQLWYRSGLGQFVTPLVGFRVFWFFRSGFESIDFLFMSTNFSFSHKLDMMESGLYGSNPVLLLLHHFCNNLCPVEISDILAWNYVWIFSHIFQNFFDEIYKPLFCLLHM